MDHQDDAGVRMDRATGIRRYDFHGLRRVSLIRKVDEYHRQVIQHLCIGHAITECYIVYLVKFINQKPSTINYRLKHDGLSLDGPMEASSITLVCMLGLMKRKHGLYSGAQSTTSRGGGWTIPAEPRGLFGLVCVARQSFFHIAQ
ncbi:Uncharacterized protein Y057_1136 [Fusarium fujikuroi]|nr:Uncharacterized protein Y057_1136 [Fusarium fujikuroi]